MYRLAFSAPSKVVLFQNSHDKSLLSHLCRLQESETRLLFGSGVDLSFFSYQPLPSTSTITILMASRLLTTKGVYEFIEAADILYDRGYQPEFLLAGGLDTDNPASVTSDQLTYWRRTSRVKILGYSTNIHQLMTQSHIVCLPSYYPEGLPKVLVKLLLLDVPLSQQILLVVATPLSIL